MNVSVITLDAGNTLFTEALGRDELYARAFSELGQVADRRLLAQHRREVHDAMPESVGGHPRYSERWFQDYMVRLVDVMGFDVDPEAVRRRLAEVFSQPGTYVLFPDTVDALEDLQERGFRLALVSNWSRHLRGLLDGLGLFRFFEDIVISEEVERSKPDPAIYHIALERLAVSGRHVLHVGNNPINDLMASRRAGLQAVLLDRDGLQVGHSNTIASLRQIASLLS